MTADGLVPVTDPLPLADRATLDLEPGEAIVRDAAGETTTTLLLPDGELPWVSATGSVVGVVDGAHWDVEAGAPTTVASGPAVLVGTLADAALEIRYDPGVGPFFRADGSALVAHLGPASGIDVLPTMTGPTERVRDVVPATDAMTWTR